MVSNSPTPPISGVVGRGRGGGEVEKGGSVKKGKVFPYSLPSVGPGADPGVQAVSPQVT